MFAADQPRQVAPPLRLAAVAADLVDAEIGMRAIRQPDRGRRARDLLHRDDVLQVAHAGAAVFLLDRDAEDAEDRRTCARGPSGTRCRDRSPRRAARSHRRRKPRPCGAACRPPRRGRSSGREAGSTMTPCWNNGRPGGGSPSETCSILCCSHVGGTAMTVERMLTEEEPAADLVGRVLQEAGIEYRVRHFRRPHRPHRLGPARVPELGAHGAGARGVARRRDGRGLWPADAAARRVIGQGPWVLGNGLIGTIEAYPVQLADAAADRFLRRHAASICTRRISRRPAITAVGMRAARSAASPSR